MKFHLFNLKRSGAILVFLGCGCLTGILPAAELRPLLEDDSKTRILPQNVLPQNGPGTVETNRAPLPSATKIKMFKKPDELNFRELLNRQAAPMPPPPRMPTTADRKDRDLLDQENTWSYVTPQDILDDYMARHILKLPEYGPDGRRQKPGAALELFYQRLTRGDGTTNGMSSLALFGLQKRSEKLDKENNGKDKDEMTDDDSPGKSRRSDTFGDAPDTDLETGLSRLRTGTSLDSNLSRANKGVRDDLVETERARRAQKDHLDAVRKIWNFDSPVAAGAGSFDPASDLPWLKSGPGALPDTSPGVTRPGQPTPSVAGALPGTASNPSAQPGVPIAPTVSAPAGVPSSVISTLPPPTRTTRGPLVQPFSIPQRKF